MCLQSKIKMDLITCQYCGMKVGDYTKHLEEYKHYICKFFNKDYYFLADELYHLFIKEHSEGQKKPYSCKKCARTFSQLWCLNRHKKHKNHF